MSFICAFFGGHDFVIGPKKGQMYCHLYGKVIK